MAAGNYDIEDFEQGTDFLRTFEVHDTVKTATSLTFSGGVVTVSLSNHCYETGDYVKVSGADQCDYNGSFVVTKIDNDSFSYNITGSPNSPATGTISCAKCFNLTGYSARMQFRKNKSDSSYLLSISSSTGEITITANTGKIEVNISNSVTSSLDFSKAYYDLEIVSPSGVVTRLVEGLVFMSKEVTR